MLLPPNHFGKIPMIHILGHSLVVVHPFEDLLLTIL